MKVEEFNAIAPLLKDEVYEKMYFSITLTTHIEDVFDTFEVHSVIKADNYDDLKAKIKRNIKNSIFHNCSLCLKDIELLPL